MDGAWGFDSFTCVTVSTFKVFAQAPNRGCCASLCLQLSPLCGVAVCVQIVSPTCPSTGLWALELLYTLSTYLAMPERRGIRNKAACQRWLENGVLITPPTPTSNTHKRTHTHTALVSGPPPPNLKPSPLSMWLPSTGSTSAARVNSD